MAPPLRLTPEQIRLALHRGSLPRDATFDAHLPPEVRALSYRFWTPLAVAAKAARWFEKQGVQCVLDVGSGAGKFCTVGALTSGLSFTGIEQRPHLVHAARTLAATFGVHERVQFHQSTLTQVPFERFGGLYFYNPFGENLFPASEHFDATVELGKERFWQDVERMEGILARMPVSTCVVTYNGFGGKIPDSYNLLRSERAGTDYLRLWKKVRESWRGGYWLELQGASVLRLARFCSDPGGGKACLSGGRPPPEGA